MKVRSYSCYHWTSLRRTLINRGTSVTRSIVEKKFVRIQYWNDRDTHNDCFSGGNIDYSLIYSCSRVDDDDVALATAGRSISFSSLATCQTFRLYVALQSTQNRRVAYTIFRMIPVIFRAPVVVSSPSLFLLSPIFRHVRHRGRSSHKEAEDRPRW